MPRFLLIDPRNLVNLDQVSVIQFDPADPDYHPPQPERIHFHCLAGDILSVSGTPAQALWLGLTHEFRARPMMSIEELNKASLAALEGDDDPPPFDPFADAEEPLPGARCYKCRELLEPGCLKCGEVFPHGRLVVDISDPLNKDARP